MAPQRGLNQPYSDPGYKPEPVTLPTRERASVVQRSDGFLSHDTAMVDPYAVSTQGTTNGYTEDAKDVRRARGHAHAGIYLDQVAPRTHEQRTVHDGPVVRTGALLHERDQQGRNVAETASDFYHGSSHANPNRNLREPRRMDERFMSRVDKYESHDRQIDAEGSLGRAHATQIEEAAYRRATQRNEEKDLRMAGANYDPWTTDGGPRDPQRHGGITGDGQMDPGHFADIPGVEMRRNDQGVPDDPYRDMGGKRVVLEDRGALGAGSSSARAEKQAAANYATKWYGPVNHVDHSANFRRMRDYDSPTNAQSHGEMVRMRRKHEKEGLHDPIEGKRKQHVLETHSHYTTHAHGHVDNYGPPIVAGVEVHNPQEARGMNEFDPAPQDHDLTDYENQTHQDHRMTRAVAFDGSLEVSVNDPSVRSHMFATGRPHQRWN